MVVVLETGRLSRKIRETATELRHVSRLDRERDMGKHEPSLNSSVIGNDVTSGAHSFKLPAKI